jgi:hypothetical protein
MSKRMRFAVVPLVAGAIVALATASAWAFTQETLYPNGNYNFNFGPLDDKGKSSGFTSKSDDSNGPGWHFNVQGGNQSGSGFRSFNSNDDKPDVPGSRPIGNGN